MNVTEIEIKKKSNGKIQHLTEVLKGDSDKHDIV